MLALPRFALRVLFSGELEQRAARGSREKLMAILAKAPDVEPEEHDLSLIHISEPTRPY